MVVVYGAPYSVYSRIVRLALEEKGVTYRLEPIDIFAPGGAQGAYVERHPFARIPAIEHDGFRLYETGAIVRYVDEAFDGPALQPAGLRARAAMNQVMSIMDAYGFRTLVWHVYVERIRTENPDEGKIKAALDEADKLLRALLAIKAENPWFAGSTVSLADLYVLPMLTLFAIAPEGAALAARHAGLLGWQQRMTQRLSARRTRFPAETGRHA